jgi:PHD/YefM family antitoxin component YafN of YafNO toxin-antitoxin module
VKTKKILTDDLDAAKKTVSIEHRPVCVMTNGACVLDDVGGIYG